MARAGVRQTGAGAKWLGLVATLLVFLILGLSVGVVGIPLDQVWLAVTGEETLRASWARIVLEFRVPRLVVCVTAGAALGIAGLLLQTLFNNPLADPWFLGLVHGDWASLCSS